MGVHSEHRRTGAAKQYPFQLAHLLADALVGAAGRLLQDDHGDSWEAAPTWVKNLFTPLDVTADVQLIGSYGPYRELTPWC